MKKNLEIAAKQANNQQNLIDKDYFLCDFEESIIIIDKNYADSADSLFFEKFEFDSEKKILRFESKEFNIKKFSLDSIFRCKEKLENLSEISEIRAAIELCYERELKAEMKEE